MVPRKTTSGQSYVKGRIAVDWLPLLQKARSLGGANGVTDSGEYFSLAACRASPDILMATRVRQSCEVERPFF